VRCRLLYLPSQTFIQDIVCVRTSKKGPGETYTGSMLEFPSEEAVLERVQGYITIPNIYVKYKEWCKLNKINIFPLLIEHFTSVEIEDEQI